MRFGAVPRERHRFDPALLQPGFGVERLQTGARQGDIAHRVEDRLIVLLDEQVAGLARAAQVGVKPAAVEDRQIEARNQVDLPSHRLKIGAPGEQLVGECRGQRRVPAKRWFASLIR